jgi:uncharacterized protein (DUF2164 family)
MAILLSNKQGKRETFMKQMALLTTTLIIIMSSAQAQFSSQETSNKKWEAENFIHLISRKAMSVFYDEQNKHNESQKIISETIKAIENDYAFLDKPERTALSVYLERFLKVQDKLSNLQSFAIESAIDKDSQELKKLKEGLLKNLQGKEASKEVKKYNKENEYDAPLARDPVEGGNGRVRFPSYPRSELSPEQTISSKKSISARPRIYFAGNHFGGGPSMEFRKRYIVKTSIIGPGNEPIIAQGRNKYDTYLNHSENRRFVFFCSVKAQATTVHAVGGGFSVMGFGASVDLQSWDTMSVSKKSPLNYVPLAQESGARTRLKDVIDFCNNTFVKAMEDVVHTELKLSLNNLSYSNKDMQCAETEHCYTWFRSRIGFIANATVPRCVQRKKAYEPIMICQLFSRAGRACPVYNRKGKLISKGAFEYPCLKGYYCHKTKSGGLFSYAEGVCRKSRTEKFETTN